MLDDLEHGLFSFFDLIVETSAFSVTHHYPPWVIHVGLPKLLVIFACLFGRYVVSVKFNVRVVVLLGTVGGRDHMDHCVVAILADLLGSQSHVVQHGVPVAVTRVRRDVEQAAVNKNHDLTAGVAELGDLYEAILEGGLQIDEISQEANVVDSTFNLATVIVRALHEARLCVGHDEHLVAELYQVFADASDSSVSAGAQASRDANAVHILSKRLHFLVRMARGRLQILIELVADDGDAFIDGLRLKLEHLIVLGRASLAGACVTPWWRCFIRVILLRRFENDFCR